MRSKPDDGWVPVANTVAQSRQLSWRAKGLLVDLLSFPDEFDVTFKKLMKWASDGRDPDVEGREAMRKAMQELERKGYLAHRRIPVDGPGAQRWRTETFVCDQALLAGQPGGTDSWDLQSLGLPGLGISKAWDLFNKTRTNKTKEEQDEAGKDPSAFAAAHAGQHAGANDLPPELADLYAAANKLDDDRLRRLLLQFEDNRPTKYREARRSALGQLKREDPKAIKYQNSVTATDLLSFKYGLLHYFDRDKPALGIPVWLRRFPR